MAKKSILIMILMFLAMCLFFSKTAFAEKGDTHGQIGGSFDFEVDQNLKSSLGYYVETQDQLRVIREWFDAPKNIEKVRLATDIYDLFLIVVHPRSVIDGKINPMYTGAFSESQISDLNQRISDISISRNDCLLVPIAVGDSEGKVNLLQFFVYSKDGTNALQSTLIEECLQAGFELVWKD